jgi:hypothetical protein
MATLNVYDVPKKQWRRWSDLARKAFNGTYGFMVQNQELVKHPKTRLLEAWEWNTIAHNAAWMAADAVNGRGFKDDTPVKLVTPT